MLINLIMIIEFILLYYKNYNNLIKIHPFFRIIFYLNISNILPFIFGNLQYMWNLNFTISHLLFIIWDIPDYFMYPLIPLIMILYATNNVICLQILLLINFFKIYHTNFNIKNIYSFSYFYYKYDLIKSAEQYKIYIFYYILLSFINYFLKFYNLQILLNSLTIFKIIQFYNIIYNHDNCYFFNILSIDNILIPELTKIYYH